MGLAGSGTSAQTESTQNCWLSVPNGRTLRICSFSCGAKGSVNEMTNGGDDGTPDRVGLAPQVGCQQADVACHCVRQPTHHSR